jgi:hypothetical protein
VSEAVRVGAKERDWVGKERQLQVGREKQLQVGAAEEWLVEGIWTVWQR